MSRRTLRAGSAIAFGVLVAALAVATPPVAGAGCTINGTSGDDVLHGTSGGDVICGHGGNDTIFGHEGTDTIYGGPGNDTIYGGDNIDWIAGEGGNDWIAGEKSSDTIYGGDGTDTIYGGTGHDHIKGESGIDIIKGEGGNDTIYGDKGSDHLYGDEGNDKIYGGTGHDVIRGGSGMDVLRGEDDNDTLYGEKGSDELRGGRGVDNCIGGTSFKDVVTDASCESRSEVERLRPAYNHNDTTCGPNDVSCLSFSGYKGISNWKFPECNKHNCTLYVAHRLSLRGVSLADMPSGNAYQWNDNPGVLTPLSVTVPKPGDVAHWEIYGGPTNDCDGRNCGHVAYVERLNFDSAGKLASIVVSESSWCTGGKIRTIHVGGSAPWPTTFLRL